MSEPGKYWDVKKFDVGRELANPDWVEWASNKIEKLKESRNVLLDKLKDARLLCQYLSKHEKAFNEAIQKAEALKESESHERSI